MPINRHRENVTRIAGGNGDRMTSQTVIVTGAAGGIGRASARQLLREGNEVVAFDLSREALATALEGAQGPLELVAGDVSRPEACEAVVRAALKRFGKVDAVLHWAAQHSTQNWSDLDAEEFNRTLAVNVTGSFLIAQAAARPMAERHMGSIVLCSSGSFVLGSTGGSSGRSGPAYVASKAAIVGLVRSLARSLGPSGIRVNAIAPGVTETPMIGDYTPETRAAKIPMFALGRIGQPEDISGVGSFLISDAARFITGEMIFVNGGSVFG